LGVAATFRREGVAKLPLLEPGALNSEPRLDHRISSSMLPRPESDGDGVPTEDGHCSGNLLSSLFTLRRAIVLAATRAAERLDTAKQMLRNKSASEGVYVLPLGRG